MVVERFIIRTSQGFDVLEGRRLNRAPLSRSVADRLAAPPPPRPMVRAPAPAPAPGLPDLRPTAWDAAGGSVGFHINGAPRSW
jgi:hypothetical protein